MEDSQIEVNINYYDSENNYMNAELTKGSMSHGRRYIACIHANTTIIQHETWTQTLEPFSSCSDGMTVDLTPPTPGKVWIGNDRTDFFQV